MTARPHSVAVLVGQPALAAILSGALELEAGYRVPSFARLEPLLVFLRLAPIDALVVDLDTLAPPAALTIGRLKRDPRLASQQFAIVALRRDAAPAEAELMQAGADAVLDKPVTPARLIGRLQALLAPRPTVSPMRRASDRVPGARPAAARAPGSNVVALFGETRQR